MRTKLSRSLRCQISTLIAVPFLCACLVGVAQAECAGEDGGSSLVAEIRSGDTLILQDGRSVRLAGVVLPRRSGHVEVAAQAREAAERAIADLVLNQVVELQLDARRRDRYGRILAQLFVTKDGQRLWVQERLIASGSARVMGAKDNRRCIPELLKAEMDARETGEGQWGTGLFSVKSATSEDSLLGLAQSYEIVEGRIETVAEVGNRVYLNFGKNWRRDFTVVVSKDTAKLFDDGGNALAKLRGRMVRVRGWLENINGPSISLSYPEQLEILGGGTTSQR